MRRQDALRKGSGADRTQQRTEDRDARYEEMAILLFKDVFRKRVPGPKGRPRR
jgi:hypothetical protein